MKNLIIIGARGFGREVYCSFINSNDYLSQRIGVKGFLDDKADALDGMKGEWPPILCPVEDYKVEEGDVFFCAMGDPNWRKHYVDIIKEQGGEFINIIHKTALISPNATIGEGCIIGGYTSISTNVIIGDHVMIQPFSNFGHDVVVGDYASIESYVFLGGYASVGAMSTMHTRSSIIPHKSIGKGCVVGIGSVVMKNVGDGVHVFGNPAKKMEF